MAQKNATHRPVTIRPAEHDRDGWILALYLRGDRQRRHRLLEHRGEADELRSPLQYSFRGGGGERRGDLVAKARHADYASALEQGVHVDSMALDMERVAAATRRSGEDPVADQEMGGGMVGELLVEVEADLVGEGEVEMERLDGPPTSGNSRVKQAKAEGRPDDRHDRWAAEQDVNRHGRPAWASPRFRTGRRCGRPFRRRQFGHCVRPPAAARGRARRDRGTGNRRPRRHH